MDIPILVGLIISFVIAIATGLLAAYWNNQNVWRWFLIACLSSLLALLILYFLDEVEPSGV